MSRHCFSISQTAHMPKPQLRRHEHPKIVTGREAFPAVTEFLRIHCGQGDISSCLPSCLASQVCSVTVPEDCLSSSRQTRVDPAKLDEELCSSQGTLSLECERCGHFTCFLTGTLDLVGNGRECGERLMPPMRKRRQR